TEIEYDETAQTVLNEEQVVEVSQVFTDNLIHLDDFTADSIKEQIKATQKETKHKGKKLFMPISVATTGQTSDQGLTKASQLIGKELILKRLDVLLKELEA